MYRVYLIRNPTGRRYIGVSEDVAVRLSQHNAGQSQWTSRHGPWQLAWTSRLMPLGEARQLENLMKRQKGGAGLPTLMHDFGS